MKRFAQILAVAGALSMLVGFVVYSQQKTDRPVGYLKIGQAGASTNATTRAAPDPAVAPGSKSQAPLVAPAAPVAVNNKIQISPSKPADPDVQVSDIVASSSKSTLIITPQFVQAPSAVFPPNPPAHYFAPTGRIIMYATKSAPVITPSFFINQRQVVMVTNPPQRKVAP